MQLQSASEAQAYVRERYASLGYELGWSYLYSPTSSLQTARLVTIGLNPGGGDKTLKWTEEWSYEDGNAYLRQPWAKGGGYTPLQKQIQKLRLLFPHIQDREILSFQYIPFRSRSWSALQHKAAAIDVGEVLFDWVWRQIDPELVVCFGISPVQDRLLARIGAKHEVSFATGWGDTTAEVFRFGESGRLVSLPHLSRYQVIGRREFKNQARVFGVNQPSAEMTGGCACGRVRFSARIEDDDAYLCHCRMCQRATGSVSIAFKNIKCADVEWLSGPDWYDSSPIARRPYCRECGTSLGFAFNEGSEKMDLTVAAFDDPSRFVPRHHFGAESIHRAWLDTSGLPEHRTEDHQPLVDRWLKAAGKLPD